MGRFRSFPRDMCMPACVCALGSPTFARSHDSGKGGLSGSVLRGCLLACLAGWLPQLRAAQALCPLWAVALLWALAGLLGP